MVTKDETAVELREELLDRVRQVVQLVWPSSDAPIHDIDVVPGAAGTSVSVTYGGNLDLSNDTISMVWQALRTKLGIPDLILKAQRIIPPAAAKVPGDPAQGQKLVKQR